MTKSRVPHRHTDTNHRHAFSLVEVVIVMLILGILAAVAVPKYQEALSRRCLQSATNRLVADISSGQIQRDDQIGRPDHFH